MCIWMMLGKGREREGNTSENSRITTSQVTISGKILPNNYLRTLNREEHWDSNSQIQWNTLKTGEVHKCEPAVVLPPE